MHCCGHDGAIGMPDAASINPCLCGARETQAALARIEADLSRREALGGTAAVRAADWSTYVCSHLYTPKASSGRCAPGCARSRTASWLILSASA